MFRVREIAYLTYSDKYVIQETGRARLVLVIDNATAHRLTVIAADFVNLQNIQ